MKRTKNVLTEADRERLDKAKARAKAASTTKFTVKFSRAYYRIHDPSLRRLARWQEAEAAVFRLCSDRDRRGNFAGDRRMATALLNLLSDVFKVDPS